MAHTIKMGTYRHYKGKSYKILGIAHHSETLEELVVYRALYPSKQFGKNALWVRPKSMFLGKVSVKGKKISRFTFVK
jgi:cyclomaltodextrinase / maltogenic alpha-amylase / neopullulanase